MKLLKKIFGTRNDRVIRQYLNIVAKINACEESLKSLTDDELRDKTDEFKSRISNGSSLDDLLVDAFAVVREASCRTLGLRHFDVQCVGGIILHYGKIAEMRTGEGKTLMSTLAAYLNALAGKGVHVITVNDYLAQRDAMWMSPVFESLGMTVGVNVSGMDHKAKQDAYACDVTYGTNNEFGFDYLRDNMVFSLDQRVQRDLFYCVIDEVDSILIDEARTPLIISGNADQSSDLYEKINKLTPELTRQHMEEGQNEDEIEEDKRGDYIMDEKNRQTHLTDLGHKNIEELLVKAGILGENDSLYDVSNIKIMHYVNASLKAHSLYQKDVHYVVKDGQVIIVDEHTGRLMDGRRWSDGLHQAVEAKEHVDIQIENQTLATITFQNYFRLYNKLSGMTGTADTEAFELRKIYNLEVIVVPTNKPMIREDKPDQVFLSQKEKYQAMVLSIEDAVKRKQPVLVGTASIEHSELLSTILQKEKIKHEVLNAKQHEREASIIENAGRPGAVTIATNMAGRGTDIVLGGSLEAELLANPDMSEEEIADIKSKWQLRHDEVLAAGGLFLVGAERHESRRIDNQLRGRAGRQGDPGSSQFYLSMEDNLLRIFAASKMTNMLRRMGLQEGEVIEHSWITGAIEKAQRRVEGMNFDVRKQLLEYDDVANDQRKVVYAQRYKLLTEHDISDALAKMQSEVVSDLVASHMPADSLEEQWDIAGLEQHLLQEFDVNVSVRSWLAEEDELNGDGVAEKVLTALQNEYKHKEDTIGSDKLREIEKNIMLQLLDMAWKDHLAAMDHLRQGVHLRGYAQKDPKQEFKRESFGMFTDMLGALKYDLIVTLSKLNVNPQESFPPPAAVPEMTFNHSSIEAEDKNKDTSSAGNVKNKKKVGRNEPCPCGSGKKYKQCHGRLTKV